MPFKTRVTEMLAIEHPIIMGGMTGVGTPELAAAVSNAGGLGIIAIHNAGNPENGRKWIQKLKTLTDKPFGVNLTILPTSKFFYYSMPCCMLLVLLQTRC